MSSNILMYRNSDGAVFSAPVRSGSQVGPTVTLGSWEQDWAHIVSFRLGEAPYVLLYRNSGEAFTAPVLSESEIGSTTPIGNWESDWAQIISFEINGTPYLLFYRRTDGSVFTAAILSPSSIGPTTLIGNAEKDWAHIVSFRFDGAPFILFYRDSGAAFTAPILSGSRTTRRTGLTIGPTTPVGNWESDWAQIVSFRSNGAPFFLLYRNTGATFTAPILSSSQIGPTSHIGDWESDWAQLLQFDIRTSENFAYAYDPILTENEVRNAEKILASLAETSENDFLKVQTLFQTTGGFGPNNHILVWVTNQIVSVGGGHEFGYGPEDRKSQISISASITSPNAAKYIFVLELAEIFMCYQSYLNQGNWNPQDSKGEALSCLVGELLYPNAAQGYPGDRISNWLNDKSHPIFTPEHTLDHYVRHNWIDVTEPTDANWISFGCGLLFMYWLNTVARYDFPQIIAAKGLTFAELYSNLTGGQPDAWLRFKDAVDNLFPESNNPSFAWNGTNNIFSP